MGAWLERRVEGCPSRGCACLFQRDDFGVPDAIPRVEALTDDRAIFDDDGPDHRAWTRETRALVGKVQSSAHVSEVVHDNEPRVLGKFMPRTTTLRNHPRRIR